MRARRGAAPARPSSSRGARYPLPPLFPTQPRPLAAPGCPARAALLSTRRVQSPQLSRRAWARTPRGCRGPRAGAGALEGGGGRGPEWVGAAPRPRATRAPPPGPAAATSPNFFFSRANFPGPVPGVGGGGGCLQVSSSAREDQGPSAPHPALRPLGAGPRPPPQALADPRAGRGGGGVGGGGGRNSGSQAHPPPQGAPREGATAPSARLASSTGRKELIIDWVIGVAEAPSGPDRRAAERRSWQGCVGGGATRAHLRAAARARVGRSSLGRPPGGGG